MTKKLSAGSTPARRAVLGVGLALSLAVAPAVLSATGAFGAQGSVLGASGASSAAAAPLARAANPAETVLTTAAQAQMGNETVAALYDQSPAVPGQMNMWPSGTTKSLSLQHAINRSDPSTATGTCATTLMAQSTSKDFEGSGANMGAGDVTRPVSTTPWTSGLGLQSSPAREAGFVVTRAARAGETPNTKDGRVKLAYGDNGYTTAVLDGWGGAPRYSRIKIATPVDVHNYRLVMRMDDNATLNEDVTTMSSDPVRPVFAGTYERASSDAFRITYETHDGVRYAVVSADVFPAHTWASVIFSGTVPTEVIGAETKQYAYLAATGDFGYQCDAPAPEWNGGTVRAGNALDIANSGDAVPQNTKPRATTVEVRDADAPAGRGGWAASSFSVSAASGVMTLAAPEDAVGGGYSVPVTMTLGDGTKKAINATFRVIAAPKYLDTAVEQGASATVKAPLEATGSPIEEGATYAADTSNPNWAAVSSWVKINADGTVTVAPSFTQKPGEYTVPVKITFKDGQVSSVKAKVTVDELKIVAPAYGDSAVKPGDSVTVPAPVGPDAKPVEHVKDFTPATGDPAWNAVKDWVVVNPDGSLTLAPPVGVAPGDYTVPVTVTYENGETATIQARVSILAPAQPTSTVVPIDPTRGSTDEPTSQPGDEGGLAETGAADVSLAIMLGIGALGIGAGALAAARRRCSE